GRLRSMAYDADGRETGETWYNADSSLAQRVTYSYDADSNRTSAANAAGAYSYAFDPLDRVTGVTEPFSLTLTYAYDAVGNRTLTQDSKGGVATYGYDAANRLTQQQLTQGGTAPLRVDYAYTGRDQPSTATRYSDLSGTTKVGSTSYSYDAVGRT